MTTYIQSTRLIPLLLLYNLRFPGRHHVTHYSYYKHPHTRVGKAAAAAAVVAVVVCSKPVTKNKLPRLRTKACMTHHTHQRRGYSSPLNPSKQKEGKKERKPEKNNMIVQGSQRNMVSPQPCMHTHVTATRLSMQPTPAR